MKIMVISSPIAVPEEATLMNALLQEGLELLHLRKPAYSKKELIALALQVKETFRSRLVLHSHHAIAENLGINRLHFPEAIRLYTADNELKKWRAKNFTLSTSIHSVEDYQALSSHFAYTFLGPVFKSISKYGYGPSAGILPDLNAVNRSVEIIAIGGISPDKISALQNAGFDGAAMLGAVWLAPEKAINTLKLCQQNANLS
jgi:thiamine-phosphate pyrophosphorylase